MIFILAYGLLLVLITWLHRRRWQANLLRAADKVSPILAAISLFISGLSIDGLLVTYETLSLYGLPALTLFWSGLPVAFFIPWVMAPIWNRLGLRNDNRIILLRYSGTGARILYVFRKYYVGIVIVALGLSFQILAFSRALEALYGWGREKAVGVTSLLVVLYSFKNVFSIKLRTDVLHTVMFFLVLTYILIKLLTASYDWTSAFQTLYCTNPKALSLLPTLREEWYALLVYFGINSWAASMFDGGGAEMIRFTAVDSPAKARKAGLMSLAFGVGMSFMSLILVFLFLAYSQQQGMSANLISLLFSLFPPCCKEMFLIGIFGLFISTAETQLLWSAGLWAEDAYRQAGWLRRIMRRSHFILTAMGLLSFFAGLIAYHMNSFYRIISYMIGLSAGVAPFFVMRWFWMRVNAWGQLAAMVSALIYNLIYDILTTFYPHIVPDSVMSAFAQKILVITPLVLSTGFLAMFLTPPDPPQRIEAFLKKIPARGLLLSQTRAALVAGLVLTVAWWAALAFLVELLKS